MVAKLLLIAMMFHSAERSFGTFRITGYCSCRRCCGKWADGITATGQRVKWGIVAADWRVIPKHSRIRIRGFKTVFKVEDKGGAIKGKRIDIWFPSHKQALRFGVAKRRVWLVKSGKLRASARRSRKRRRK